MYVLKNKEVVLGANSQSNNGLKVTSSGMKLCRLASEGRRSERASEI